MFAQATTYRAHIVQHTQWAKLKFHEMEKKLPTKTKKKKEKNTQQIAYKPMHSHTYAAMEEEEKKHTQSSWHCNRKANE